MWGVVDPPGGMLGFSRDEQCIGVGRWAVVFRQAD
jgi:cation transport regulator ChaC